MQSIVVDDDNNKLAYLDSGAPSSGAGYITIFILHGMIFSAHVFEKLLPLAPKTGLRVVAINRRDYPGSSTIPASEVSILQLAAGGDEQKAALLSKRGVEVATFIDRFIVQNGILPISADGKTGGVAIVGWSLGVAFALAAFANIDILPSETRARFATHLRSVILQDAPSVALGLPSPEQAWTPLLDDSMPLKERGPFFNHWVSAYFKHGDLTGGDVNNLAYVTPSTHRAPSIYSMSETQLEQLICESGGQGSDLWFMLFHGVQRRATYEKACFDKALRALMPRVKIWVVTGGMSPSFPVVSHFALQEDDKAHGGGYIRLKMVEETNHFIHWDDPQLALDTYLTVSL